MEEFKLNDNEVKAAEKFENTHKHKEVNKGAIGGHIQYIFTPTAVGTGKSIKCIICGKVKNITDYDCW